MTIGFVWRAQSTIYRDSVDLLAVRDCGNEIETIQPLEIAIKRHGRYDLAYGEPTLALSHDSAKSLIQALWDAGLRPNNGEGSGAEAAALKNHIRFAEGVTTALLHKGQS